MWSSSRWLTDGLDERFTGHWKTGNIYLFSASVKLPTYEKACNDIPFATPNDDDQNNTSDDAPQQVITIFFLK